MTHSVVSFEAGLGQVVLVGVVHTLLLRQHLFSEETSYSLSRAFNFYTIQFYTLHFNYLRVSFVLFLVFPSFLSFPFS